MRCRLQLSLEKVVEGLGLLRDELDERIVSIRSLRDVTVRRDVAAHQIDFCFRRLNQVWR